MVCFTAQVQTGEHVERLKAKLNKSNEELLSVQMELGSSVQKNKELTEQMEQTGTMGAEHAELKAENSRLQTLLAAANKDTLSAEQSMLELQEVVIENGSLKEEVSSLSVQLNDMKIKGKLLQEELTATQVKLLN